MKVHMFENQGNYVAWKPKYGNKILFEMIKKTCNFEFMISTRKMSVQQIWAMSSYLKNR